MATFYIISTTNAHENGWSIFKEYSNRSVAEKEISDVPEFQDHSDNNNDIYAQTLLANARVVSKTEAERKYHLNGDVDDFYNNEYDL